MTITPWVKQQEDYDGSSIIKPGTLIIGRYLVEKRVGGSLPNVYLAHDKQTNRPCALKEIVISVADEAQYMEFVEDFQREARLLANLEHPAIARILDYFIIEKKACFLVSEFVVGSNLLELLTAAPEGKLDERMVTQWAIQICDLLAYLHTQQIPIIIFRAFNLCHFMIDENNQVKQVNLGITRIIPQPQKAVTSICNMGYAPPEFFAGKVQPATDIYLLGKIMFHLLTGTDPDDNPLFVFDFTRWPRPRQINPELSEGMEKIIMKAVEHKPVNRYGSALEMKKVLEDHRSTI
jgi:serine/threonine-protein kinase